jgi:hypothetical protein
MNRKGIAAARSPHPWHGRVPFFARHPRAEGRQSLAPRHAKGKPMNAFETVQLFSKMLRNLDRWLVLASEHAAAKPFDVEVLVEARLAPDQYAFARQVQSACDSAKYAAAYLGGKPAPSHPDTEKTMGELRARIATCLGFLETFGKADFNDADERRVAPPWLKGKWLRGADYHAQLAIPNFFFHVTTAYAILRHNGVNLGKMDFIGDMPIREG